jgi:DNA repair exonuclease SbcCD ATPase subunit
VLILIKMPQVSLEFHPSSLAWGFFIFYSDRQTPHRDALIAEQPSETDRLHYELRLAETLQILSRLTDSLEKSSQGQPMTADAIRQQLERLHMRLEFAKQTLADPATDEHLRRFVEQEHKRLLEISNNMQQELRRLEPGAVWQPSVTNDAQQFDLELNQATEEVRRLSQLRETLSSWISRLSSDSDQLEKAQARMQQLEQALETANVLMDDLQHRKEDAAKIPETRGAP